MLCDPPYGLSFMGKAWDHGVPGPEVWSLVLRALKPGAHLLAFGGTRTFHRLTCAIEDAGFEIRDCLSWLYGSGFPKSKALREVGADWQGYGTSIKPSWEPCIVAMKPPAGTFAQNALAHGVAGLNVDGCRIGNRKGWPASESTFRGFAKSGESVPTEPRGVGRWPANVVLSHHEDCRRVVATLTSREWDHETGGPVQTVDPAERWECVEGCAVRMLDEQSGESYSSNNGSLVTGQNTRCRGEFGPRRQFGYEDRGGASRFFYCAKASRSEREAGLREAGLTSDGYGSIQRDFTPNKIRNHHPTVKPLDLCEWLARLILPPKRDTPRRLLVPFSGSGSEMIGSLRAGWDEVVGIEREPAYVAISEARLRHETRQAIIA